MRTAWWCASVVVATACSGSDPSASAVAHDPCAPLAIRAPGATSVQQAGIAGALALWRGRGVTAFADDAAALIDIRFETAGAAFHGQYDPDSASVLINRDLTAAADPEAMSIVIAHELGHVFGLEHVDPALRRSLMNAGNLSTPPTDDDQRALEAMWGACAPAAP